MAYSKLATNRCDQIAEVCAMPYMSEQRTILFIDRRPISSMELCIVEVLPLNAPSFAKYILPLRSWINLHFQLRDVEGSIAYSDGSRTIRWHNSPTGSTAGTTLIQKFLFVGGKRIRANAFEKRRGRAFFQLISLQTERRWCRSSCQNRLGVIEASRRASLKIAVITSRNVH